MSQVPGLGHVTFYRHSTLFHYAPVLELSVSTTNRCTQTQLIIKIPCTQLKYLSTHCNRRRS
jgi:hypothetical protein